MHGLNISGIHKQLKSPGLKNDMSQIYTDMGSKGVNATEMGFAWPRKVIWARLSKNK